MAGKSLDGFDMKKRNMAAAAGNVVVDDYCFGLDSGSDSGYWGEAEVCTPPMNPL